MATKDNLQAAFAGESQANRKYTAFAKKADEEGLKQVAKLFRAAAEAETLHALMHFRVMGGVKSTAENVQAAVDGEGYEYKKMYPDFLREAKKEDNPGAMESFGLALQVEKVHHALYSKALEAVKSGKDAPAAAIWVCGHCGNTVVGEPPKTCPVCGRPREMFFEVK
jgi:rubrerythrin